ncbi:hypothetical protein ACFWUW_33610 [Streptomyces sp. NPDC058655]|uniref:hypothetical protein n=1 Tax=Streptomyces sp. NPDC058655 TaxID=3346577 RepID=UPI0036533E37
MSFGDPNNPYGQQPQAPQGQPGYGYPQQAPQGVPPQGGYGYPQQGAPAGYPAGPGGFPGAPVEMPGGVKAARVMLWVIAALQVVGVGLLFVAVAALSKLKDDPELKATEGFDTFSNFGSGVLYVLIAVAVVYLAASIMLALQVGKGGNSARIGIIVYASFGLLLSIYPFFPLSLIHLVLLILVIVFVSKSDGSAWFNRHRG